MSEIATAYVQIEPTFKGVKSKIENEMGDSGEKGGKSFSEGFGKVIGTAGKVVAGAAVAGATAVAGIVKSATQSYGEYEQLVGGVELLFGRTEEETEALRQSMLDSGMSARQVADEIANISDASDIVMKNAESAFSRVQMSTNDYLQTANSFATGLKESLGGDSEAAANLADAIIVAQADVVAATGNNAENVANAFAGIMKNNFTMLDNLQLGITPTKEGMQEVIDKMNELNGTEYEMGNLADMQSAIVDYIDYVGMAGYAQNEAAGTIQGSLATLKASWENVLSGMGNKDADLSALIGNLASSAETFIGNILPIVKQALTGVSTLIANLAPVIAQELPGLLKDVLPMLLTSGVQIVETLGPGLLSAIPELMPSITELVVNLGTMIVEMLPQLLVVGMEVLLSLATGIAEALPSLIPTIVNVMLQIVQTLIENVPLLINAAVQLLLGLANGLITALPVLIEQLPTIITAIVTALVTSIPLLIDGAIQLINGIVAALPDIITALIEALPLIIDAIVTGLIANLPILIDGAIQLVISLVTALPQIILALVNAMPVVLDTLVKALIQAAPKLLDAAKQMITTLKDGWTQFFPTLITSAINLFNGLKTALMNYVKKFMEIGKQIVEGIKQGISNAWSAFKDWVLGLLGGLVDGIQEFFHIGSPSKLMADEIGQWIPAGIAEGIQNGMGILNKSIDGMSNDLLGEAINSTVSGNMAYSVGDLSDGENSSLYQLLSTYLPEIVKAVREGGKYVLEADAGRMFRVMQREAARNAQIVGPGATPLTT